MKLAAKLAIVITLAVSPLLIAQAVLNVRQISQIQQREIRDDLRIFAEVLRTSVEETWRTLGPKRAHRFVALVDSRHEHTEITLSALGTSDAFTPVSEVSIEPVENRENWEFTAVAPIVVDGRPKAELQIFRSTPLERRFFRDTLFRQVGTTLAAMGLCAMLVLLLGIRFVGRPISQLSTMTHRVAEGDYQHRADVRQRDEIGALANDFNTMTEELAASHKRVSEERHARTSALEQLRHADRLSTVGRIASTIAHELGTPLNVASGRAAMITDDETASESVRGNAKIIVEQTQRITASIRELLDFSRQSRVRKSAASMQEILRHAVSLMEPLAEKLGVRLQVGAEEDIEADVDAQKLLQVLTNLMMNAMHAMPDGGTISVAAGSVEVDQPKDSRFAPGEYVVLAVRDQGTGMAPEHIAHIFQPFFTTKEEGKGTGLGLTVCQGIVSEHGGWIDVDSEIGKGTLFSIYLPRRDPHD